MTRRGTHTSRQVIGNMRAWQREAARASMCDGKGAFLTFTQARQHGRKMRRGGRGAMQPYRCPWCQRWHLGSRE